jgi:hypothetical protein
MARALSLSLGMRYKLWRAALCLLPPVLLLANVPALPLPLSLPLLLPPLLLLLLRPYCLASFLGGAAAGGGGGAGRRASERRTEK